MFKLIVCIIIIILLLVLLQPNKENFDPERYRDAMELAKHNEYFDVKKSTFRSIKSIYPKLDAASYDDIQNKCTGKICTVDDLYNII